MVAAEYETAWWAREHCIDAVLDGDSAIYCVPRREFNDFQEKLLLKYGVAPFLNRVNYQLSDAIARIIEPTISELLRESFPNATIEKTGELVWEIKSKEKRATISCKEYEIHRSLSVIVKPIVFYNEYDRKEFASIADALEFIRSLFSEASGE